MPRIAMDDGVELHVEVGPDNGKPPLLFLNALGADHTMWDGQVAAFSEHFRVLRLDDRGHGQSAPSETPYTIDRLGRDARGVLEAFDIDSAHVVGLSKGGMTAAWLGINCPEHVEKLVIVSSSPHLPPREMWEGRANTARRCVGNSRYCNGNSRGGSDAYYGDKSRCGTVARHHPGRRR